MIPLNNYKHGGKKMTEAEAREALLARTKALSEITTEEAARKIWIDRTKELSIDEMESLLQKTEHNLYLYKKHDNGYTNERNAEYFADRQILRQKEDLLKEMIDAAKIERARNDEPGNIMRWLND